jgi:hypothetical protein
MSRDAPWLSVIIPIQDPGAELVDCLESLADLNEPELEVILLNRSGPETLAGAQALARKRSLILRTMDQTGQSAAAAFNAGASQAQGEVLFFTSQHCRTPPHLAGRLKQLFADPALSATGGGIRPLNSNQPLARLIALERSCGLGGPERDIEPCPQMYCAAFRATAFRQAGMCHEASVHTDGRDLDLCGAILAQGGIISQDPELWVRQQLPGAWRQIWRSQIRRGENLLNELPSRLRSGGEAYLQPVLLLLALGLLLAMGPQDPSRAISLALICLLLLYPLNRAFLKCVGAKDPGLLKTAFLLCCLRPPAWILGMIKAVLGRLVTAVR